MTALATNGTQADARMRLCVFALLITSLLAFYPATWFAMARIWWTSDTFAHGMFIAPISAWLVYRLRAELGRIPRQTDWWALGGLVLAGVGWMLAYAADVLVIQQFALVLMIPLFVMLCFGRDVTRAIAFPLGFLLLAVPAGEGLIPTMTEWTANFVVFALRAVGIPVFREGNNFVIPSGTWSVVKGCSGLRYLMATITVALLFAYLNYRAAWRRVVFVLGSIGVAVVGNWLRAFAIVMIAHLSDMRLALGIDHYIYGWVFFGILIFAVMWLGSLWREPDLEPRPLAAVPADRASAPAFQLWPCLLLACAVLLSPLLLVRAGESAAARLADSRLASIDAPAGWHQRNSSITAWQPEQHGADQVIDATFSDGTRSVAIHVFYYPMQRQDAELVNARNRLLYEKDKTWRELRYPAGTVAWGDKTFPYRESKINARDNTSEILVWQGWWVAGRYTTNAYVAKLIEAVSMLAGRGRRAAWVVVYTPIADGNVEDARAALADFSRGFGSVFEDLIAPRALTK